MWLLVRIFLFLVINALNLAIALVGVSYFNPDFHKGYLLGKVELYNTVIFRTGLLIHASVAPLVLIIASLLVLFRIELKFPKTHRLMGKLALILGLFLLVPSGFVLSYFAMGGPVGRFLFVALSAATGFTILSGYSAIRRKDIQTHRYWMHNLLLMLCSALILRLLMVLFAVFEWTGDTMYCTAAFLSWVPAALIMRIWFYPKSKEAL